MTNLRLFRPKKARPKPKELLLKYINGSSCFVHIVETDTFPRMIHIEFHGELAQIPSLKNSKITGKNGHSFTNPVVRAKLDAMDHLFLMEVQKAGFKRWKFGAERVQILLHVAKRNRKFDEDNAMSTVKDWLEPHTKLVGRTAGNRDRGWGVGIINNDHLAHGFPVTDAMLGTERDHTEIIIRPLNDMREAIANFYAAHHLF